MKTRSAKAKGRRLQNKIRDLLLEEFKELEPDDIRTAIMGETGEDIKLSPAARRKIPYSFECKNQEKLNIWEAYNQACDNAGHYEPIVVIKRNNQKPLVLIDAEYFMVLHNGH